MAKSALLENLCDAYCKFQPDQVAQTNAKAFCDFAAAELASRGVIGVSYTAAGLALRFSNGDELAVVSLEDAALTGPAVQVTGMAEKLNARPDAVVSPAFPITGR